MSSQLNLFPKALSLAVHELRTPLTVVSGYLRMLLKEQGGPLTPDNDEAALAGAVLDLLNDPARAQRMAAAAHASCAAYEWPVAREGWLAAYRSVLGHDVGADLEVGPYTA